MRKERIRSFAWTLLWLLVVAGIWSIAMCLLYLVNFDSVVSAIGTELAAIAAFELLMIKLTMTATLILAAGLCFALLEQAEIKMRLRELESKG